MHQRSRDSTLGVVRTKSGPSPVKVEINVLASEDPAGPGSDRFRRLPNGRVGSGSSGGGGEGEFEAFITNGNNELENGKKKNFSGSVNGGPTASDFTRTTSFSRSPPATTKSKSRLLQQ